MTWESQSKTIPRCEHWPYLLVLIVGAGTALIVLAVLMIGRVPVAKATHISVSSFFGFPVAPLHPGFNTTNTFTRITNIAPAGGSVSDDDGLYVLASPSAGGMGLYAAGRGLNGPGVLAHSFNETGVARSCARYYWQKRSCRCDSELVRERSLWRQHRQCAGVFGRTGRGFSVHGKSSSGTGVRGEAVEGTGIYGESVSRCGVLGSSNCVGQCQIAAGVFAEGFDADALFSHSARGFGVFGDSTQNHGIVGQSSARGFAGIRGLGSQAVGIFAGDFVGDVRVVGTINKSALAFKIDHPLDPANKYLSHSSVESPDMKTIYDGVVVLDDKGEASVQLPGWFESLNRDFRYQLTAIGASAPDLYIAEKISKSRFRIGGGRRGLEDPGR